MNNPEAGLPEKFLQGLAALRTSACPEAAVAAIDGNFIILDLGVSPLPESYVEKEARVFVRTPADFLNAEPYGVVTMPYLNRKDGQAVPHQHRGHANARPVDPNGASAGFWSWNWSSMPRRQPEDMAALFEWARKCVKDGAK